MEAGTVDYVLVVHAGAAPAQAALPLVRWRGKPAIERLFPRFPGFFEPIGSLRGAIGDAYLPLGADRGNDTLNRVPVEAQEILRASGRTPLTIEEGIEARPRALAEQQPAQTRLVLGREPAYLAGIRVGGRTFPERALSRIRLAGLARERRVSAGGHEALLWKQRFAEHPSWPVSRKGRHGSFPGRERGRRQDRAPRR